jgi:hypothetical protein
MQAAKSGGLRPAEMPPGVKLAPGVEKVDLGTHYGFINRKTGDLVRTEPKNVAGREKQEEEGKAAGKASAMLPQVKTTVENSFQTIEKLKKHPGIDAGTGMTGTIAGRVPGTSAYNFQAMNKTASGQTFMAAREALKGAGQVTDFEGARGEAAIANLDTAQSKEQYLAALTQLEKMMRASYEDLRKRAGGGGEALSAPKAPDPLGIR